MKNFIIAVAVATIFTACSDTTKKVDVKSDSTILAPETNSNMVDTRPLVTDSSRVDSGHLKPDTPAGR